MWRYVSSARRWVARARARRRRPQLLVQIPRVGEVDRHLEVRTADHGTRVDGVDAVGADDGRMAVDRSGQQHAGGSAYAQEEVGQLGDCSAPAMGGGGCARLFTALFSTCSTGL